MTRWHDAPPAPPGPKITAGGWLRVLLRGTVLALVTFGGLMLLLLVRLVERPLFGQSRPITPHITRFVCRAALVILGIRHRMRGQPMEGQGAIVANHASWLDIFALNACDLVYFVAKSEVARWPAIGWLAKATGTVFINRDGREARAQKAVFEARLIAGHRLLFFPEGTSTDGMRVLPFKTALFAAFFARPLKDSCMIQPATVVYRAPEGQDSRFYGWWGDMDFAPHLLKVLAAPRQGSVEVTFHAPLEVARHNDRKVLAEAAEASVRSALPAGLMSGD
jgi:1-acyl-sn-glycerol-3-phosphate acyltransferase